MKKTVMKYVALLAGVIILLFVAHPLLNGSFVAVVASLATLFVLALCLSNSLYALLTGRKKQAGFFRSTFKKTR